MEDQMENWGFIIKRLMESRGLSQSEFAAKSGLGQSHISRIVNGDYKTPSYDTIVKLASGLSMSTAQISKEIFGQSAPQPPTDALEPLRRLQVELQSVPIYTDFPFHAGDPVDVAEYAYLSRKGAPKHLEGYLVKGTCLEPDIKDGDIIIVDREGAIDNGDILACLIDGELHLARLRKVADELWLENRYGTRKFTECTVSAPVVRIERKLK